MKCWFFFREIPLGTVVQGIRRLPLSWTSSLLIWWNKRRTGGRKGSWGERVFIAHSFLEVVSQSLLLPSLLVVTHALLKTTPSIRMSRDGSLETSVSTPIRYEEWRWGENGHCLSTPSPRLTRGSAVLYRHWYENGLRPGGKFWKLLVKTSIYPMGV